MKTAVLGAGSWGTVLASVFAENGHETVIWARRAAVVDEISTQHTNHRYLGNSTLPVSLRGETNLSKAVSKAELILIAVPSTGVATIANELSPFLNGSQIIAHAVKGFDGKTYRRISDVIQDSTSISSENICVISGPSHAEEVIAHLPTTIVVSSRSRLTAEILQDALMNQYLRVYTNPDVVGVELGGSLKNIIALAVGIAVGMGVGDNAKAALMTRGLAEIARLGIRLGASPLTLAGLSGVGDLIVTCTSEHSRNFRAGRMIGQGISVEAALNQVGMVVEGVQTTRIADALAREADIEMPITQTLYQILFEGLSPTEGTQLLMGRSKSHEIEEVAREHLTPSWEID